MRGGKKGPEDPLTGRAGSRNARTFEVASTQCPPLDDSGWLRDRFGDDFPAFPHFAHGAKVGRLVGDIQVRCRDKAILFEVRIHGCRHNPGHQMCSFHGIGGFSRPDMRLNCVRQCFKQIPVLPGADIKAGGEWFGFSRQSTGETPSRGAGTDP